MKRSLAKHTVESSDNFERKSFSVDFSAEMFNLISNTLYSRPIEAIVRELSCNAYDSHVQHGNPETPFEVKLPTRLSPDFYIRDFGTGLTPDEIRDVYTVVFKSDKTHTNDLTGCFGVGSKSPFSYASQFSVESVVGGKKWIYSCFLDEGGIPCMADLSNGGFDTTEKNGVKISFEVANKDYNAFSSAAHKVFPYFATTPKIIGGPQIGKEEYMQEGDSWAFRGGYSYSMTPRAIMGNVAYDLDLEKLDFSCPRNMVMFFELGELTPAASREYLQYDANTTASINKKFEDILISMKGEIQKKVDACKTKFEARIEVENFERSSDLGREIAKKVTWKGDPHDWKFSLYPDTKKSYKFWEFINGKKSKVHGFPLKMNAHFIIPDVDTLKHKKTEFLSEQNPTNRYIVPTGLNEQECLEFLKEIDLPKANQHKVSKMKKPASTTRLNGKKIGILRKFKGGYHRRQRDYWIDDIQDPPEFAYYVVRNVNRVGNKAETSFMEPAEFRRTIKLLEELGVSVDVYAVTSSQVGKLPDGWKLFWDDFENFNDWLKTNTTADRLYDLKQVHHDPLKSLFSQSKIEDPRFAKLQDMSKEYWDNKEAYDSAIDKCQTDENAVRTGRNIADQLRKDYAMLKTFGAYYYSNDKATTEDYIEYINILYKEKYATIHSS